jgi:hypothetical protein
MTFHVADQKRFKKKWTFSDAPKSILFQNSSFQDENQTKTPSKISSFYLNIGHYSGTCNRWLRRALPGRSGGGGRRRGKSESCVLSIT